MPKVVVTGASGFLGSAVYEAFKRSSTSQVTGLTHTRQVDGMKQLDLLDESKLEAFFTELGLAEGDWVIHCAAERRPDVAEKNPEGTEKLNVSVPAHLSRLSSKHGFTLVYISTDYVFDGTSPPYMPDSATNPLQLYGRTKRDGEIAILGGEGKSVLVAGNRKVALRVPVLYGPAPSNSDSAVNLLLDVVQDQSGKTYNMDHFATRYPTNTLDIAEFLVRLSELKQKQPLPSIIHYSAGEPFTKYEICLIFAQMLGLDHGHIIPQPEPANDGTPRPANTQLDVRMTEALFQGSGFEGLGWNGFEEWWTAYLRRA